MILFFLSVLQLNNALYCDDLLGLYEQGVDFRFGYGLAGYAGQARDIYNSLGQAVDIPFGQAAKALDQLAVFDLVYHGAGFAHAHRTQSNGIVRLMYGGAAAGTV